MAGTLSGQASWSFSSVGSPYRLVEGQILGGSWTGMGEIVRGHQMKRPEIEVDKKTQSHPWSRTLQLFLLPLIVLSLFLCDGTRRGSLYLGYTQSM